MFSYTQYRYHSVQSVYTPTGQASACPLTIKLGNHCVLLYTGLTGSVIKLEDLNHKTDMKVGLDPESEMKSHHIKKPTCTVLHVSYVGVTSTGFQTLRPI
jgi:hypothetical protein